MSERATFADADLAKGLALSGESREYFVEGRLAAARRRLEGLGRRVEAVLDFGCGRGGTTPRLVEFLGARRAVGVDPSLELLEEARARHASATVEFRLPEELGRDERFDLAYCNGVFHHVEPARRLEAARFILDHLRPGAPFAFCENNPWNPGARQVMRRIPFDRDAIPISPPAARRLLREAGFEVLSTDALFFFPRALRRLRPLERALAAVPLGAQYLVLARKPER